MAKPGDLVEFRDGLWGISAPRNVAVWLDRYRRKGQNFVRVHTLEGPKETKAENLTRRVFKARYEGRLGDTAKLDARLRHLAALHAEGAVAEEVEEDLGKLEHALWESVCDEGPRAWTEDELALRLDPGAGPLLRRQVKAALDRCRRPGTGRFETAGRGDLWRPWTRLEHDRMKAAWEDLAALAGKLLRVETAPADVPLDAAGPEHVQAPTGPTAEGAQETQTGLEDSASGEARWVALVPEDAGLTEQDASTLQWVAAAMAQSVEHDGVPSQDIQGIGGTGAVRAFGMDLHRRLGFLAADWIATPPTDRDSDYVHFLLGTGLWGTEDAVAALTRRHVNKEAFFEHTDDPDAEAAADALPEPSLEDDPGRTDLRHLTCHTIDPPDAKDFDDAVGLEETSKGLRLWVHIADVSHYVRPDTRLDRHARSRATSVYLPGRVLPMLPHRIADHLCSLRSDGDRFALSVGMDLEDGAVTGTHMTVSMIRVDENLSYDDALERRTAKDPVFVRLFEVADAMRRHRRGLAIETGELRVLLEDTGFTSTEKRGNDATRMIETFMVAANEAVARYLAEADVAGLYRCHPLPDPQKAERFAHQAETMGLEIPMDLPERAGTKEEAATSLLDQLRAGGGKMQLFGGGLHVEGRRDPGADAEGAAGAAGAAGAEDADAGQEGGTRPERQGFAGLGEEEQEAWLAPLRHATEVIAQVPAQGLADVATQKMLACMGQAFYTATNVGHYGLGLTHYLHFTSPIRRYPDLVVHRNLKWLVAGQEGDAPHDEDALPAMAGHCSDQERAAADLERTVKDACLVLAAGGGSDRARITGIVPTGVFVRRDDGIEARAAMRDLPGGPYQVDEWESMLLLDPRDAVERFGAARLKAFLDEGGAEYRVRARLGDKVAVALAGRNVVRGRTEARVTGWT